MILKAYTFICNALIGRVVHRDVSVPNCLQPSQCWWDLCPTARHHQLSFHSIVLLSRGTLVPILVMYLQVDQAESNMHAQLTKKRKSKKCLFPFTLKVKYFLLIKHFFPETVFALLLLLLLPLFVFTRFCSHKLNIYFCFEISWPTY